MPDIAVTISFGSLTQNEINQAFAKEYNYPEQVPDPATAGQMIANPQSKKQFFEQKIKEHIRAVVKAQRQKVAFATAAAGVVEPD